MKQLKGKIVKTLPETLENSSVYLKKANDVTENRASVDGDKFTMHIVDETGVKKQLTDDTLTLDSVTKRDNTLKEEIKFTPDLEGDVDESIKLGTSRGSDATNKKNIWFTDGYSETLDEDVANLTKNSVFIGTDLKNVNFTKSYAQYIGNNIGHGVSGQSVVIGSYAVNKPENNNVENIFNNVIGLSIADKTSYNLFKQNTIIGYAAFNGSFTTLQNNVVVGTYNNTDFDGSNGPLFQTGSHINNVTLGNFNNNFPNSWANVGLGDSLEETDGSNQLPLIKLLSNYDKRQIYNYKADTNLIDSFANSITIGNYNNIVKGTQGYISRSVGSINIGSGNTKGHYRDFFNIYLGNHISSAYQSFQNAESYGNIIIGNFLSTWKDTNKLAIHNSCEGAFTKIQDSLIYGDFKDRQLKINGKLTLNPTHHNADGDINYTNQVVAKADGTLGLLSNVDNRTIEEKNLASLSEFDKITSINYIANSQGIYDQLYYDNTNNFIGNNNTHFALLFGSFVRTNEIQYHFVKDSTQQPLLIHKFFNQDGIYGLNNSNHNYINPNVYISFKTDDVNDVKCLRIINGITDLYRRKNNKILHYIPKINGRFYINPRYLAYMKNSLTADGINNCICIKTSNYMYEYRVTFTSDYQRENGLMLGGDLIVKGSINPNIDGNNYYIIPSDDYEFAINESVSMIEGTTNVFSYEYSPDNYQYDDVAYYYNADIYHNNNLIGKLQNGNFVINNSIMIETEADNLTFEMRNVIKVQAVQA